MRRLLPTLPPPGRRSLATWATLALALVQAHAHAHAHASTIPPRPPSPPLRLPAQPASGLEPGLGNLRFTSPVVVTTPPGETNRLFVVEQPGRIVVVTNLANPTRTVFLDLTASTVSGGEQGLLGLAFHPDYATNGRFFVFRTLTATTRGATNRLHDRLSEFRVSTNNPNRAATTETILFQQFDEASNHNGGDLHFGPDGYLYVSLGDEGGGNDQYNNGQTITRDFFAGILRLDVDRRPASLPPNPHPANEAFPDAYRVPPDNPYVGSTSFLGRPITDPSRVRTEFYVVGLRNPWRMAFDRVTGELWVADVGQSARESIFITRAGANHGWPFREGPIAGPRSSSAPAGFTSNPDFQFIPPLHAYSHGSSATQGRSITGGFVYRGTRFPQLAGAYVFADYVSGNVWALRRQATGAPQVERLLGEGGISAFGPDPRDGDVLLADLDGGRVLRLVPGATGGQPLPATLADTGAFANTRTLEPATGVVPYEVNLPFWSDGAEKRRWFHVPGNLQIDFTPTGPWLAPTGTVWVKHFDLPLGPSPTAPRQRLETRFLVRNASGVYGVTYRWTSATNAVLVADEGESATYDITDATGPRTVTWRFPSRAECLACHNEAAGGSLSFETAQLARDIPQPDGTPVSQIRALAHAGYLRNPPAHPGAYRRHPDPDDEQVSLEARARAYLAVNCAPCHRPGGTVGGGFFDTRLETPTDLANLILGPLNDAGENPAQRVLVPGQPDHSELLRRIQTPGPDRMPPIGSGVVDVRGANLLERWIQALPTRTTYADWRRTRLGAEAPADPDRRLDHDADGAPDYLEYLTGTDPMQPGDAWNLRATQGSGPNPPVLRFRQPVNAWLHLESATDPVAGPWAPWWPDGYLDHPPAAQPGDRELPLPVEDGEPARFLRARLHGL